MKILSADLIKSKSISWVWVFFFFFFFSSDDTSRDQGSFEE